VYLWSELIESPAILKRDGYYFMFGSHLTGWNPNDNVYSYATSLSGPWSSWRNFATVGTNTYTSQTSYILPFGDSAIYMGDRWVSSNLMRSTYIWLPLQISGTTVTMQDHVNWSPNAAAGTWAAGPIETQQEGEAAALSSGAVTISCSACSGSSAAGYIGGPPKGTVQFSGISSQATTRTTIRLKHQNGDATQRYATVTCNGVSQEISFLPTGGGSTAPGSSSLHCNLNAGTGNALTITTNDGSWGPDIDRIFVPVN
jgi:hypothetical protein